MTLHARDKPVLKGVESSQVCREGGAAWQAVGCASTPRPRNVATQGPETDPKISVPPVVEGIRACASIYAPTGRLP